MPSNVPYSNYRLTARLEIKNTPGILAKVMAVLAKNGAVVAGVDLVQVNRDTLVRDVTFDVKNVEQGYLVTEKLQKMKLVKVVSVSDQIFLIHLGGKIETASKVSVKTRNRLSMVYTPGVAKISSAIAERPSTVYGLTMKSRSVAIVSDGSSILGLGNLGANAAIPVMEGKAMIFKEFAGLNAWPICLDTQDNEEIIQTVKNIAPVFGAINLEDIKSPRCFEIEDRLKKELDIPVMHDDQHGTSIAVLAALLNALKVVKKDIKKIKIVINGLGSAGLAIYRILLSVGANHIVGCDKNGAILVQTKGELKRYRRNLQEKIDWKKKGEPLTKVLSGADVFIGVSRGNILKAQQLKKMKSNNIVFAMANPDPEVDPHAAWKYCKIFATGRSDFPNQINNALVFPGIFKGALDVRAKIINEAMRLAAAKALSKLVTKEQLNADYIIPSVFDKRVVEAMSDAVAKAAIRSGVARSRTREKVLREKK